jgi:hypothetical protein
LGGERGGKCCGTRAENNEVKMVNHLLAPTDKRCPSDLPLGPDTVFYQGNAPHCHPWPLVDAYEEIYTLY